MFLGEASQTAFSQGLTTMKKEIRVGSNGNKLLIYKGIYKNGNDLACSFIEGDKECGIEYAAKELKKTIEYDKRKGLIK